MKIKIEIERNMPKELTCYIGRSKCPHLISEDGVTKDIRICGLFNRIINWSNKGNGWIRCKECVLAHLKDLEGQHERDKI